MLVQLQDETGKPSVTHSGTEYEMFMSLYVGANWGVSCCGTMASHPVAASATGTMSCWPAMTAAIPSRNTRPGLLTADQLLRWASHHARTIRFIRS
jgi:hypothetical protein